MVFVVDVQVLRPREVPLGGPRAMTVRRTLPARERSLIGAWCFVDHYGPDDVGVTGGMDVAPHPHCGLATVSWLFEGEVEHRDSLGTHAVVRPGEVNLMTAGRGIAHAEVSMPGTSVLAGVQLWLALPGAVAGGEPRFEHFVPEVVRVNDAVFAKVFVGEAFGSRSPVRVESALVGAELRLFAGGSVTLGLPAGFEVGVLVDQGTARYAGCELRAGELGVVAAGAVGGERELVLAADAGGARVILLGGEPFDEEIVMWWNFIGRSHEDIEAARAEWNGHGPRFGFVAGYVPRGDGSWWMPAPELPGVRLKPRGNRRGRSVG